MRIGIATFAVALAVVAAGCSRPGGREGGSIAALGDSITAGYRTAEAYPERLRAWRDVPVHNFGVAGDTTEGMLRRLPEVLATGPLPQTVIVLGGTNDVAHGWPAARTMANLDAITRRVREAGRQPVLVCPPPAGALPEPALRSLRHAIREYATRNDVRAVDPWPALEDRTRPGHMRPELAMDGVHPSGRGQLVLAREIAHALGWSARAP
jgi:lysophospholipase L1-like esterase